MRPYRRGRGTLPIALYNPDRWAKRQKWLHIQLCGPELSCYSHNHTGPVKKETLISHIKWKAYWIQLRPQWPRLGSRACTPTRLETQGCLGLESWETCAWNWAPHWTSPVCPLGMKPQSPDGAPPSRAKSSLQTILQNDTCTPTFMAALISKDKTWKPPTG